MVPENIAKPSVSSNNSSKFTWGSEISSLCKYDDEDNSIILLYPFSLRANKGSNPIVSPNLKLIWVPIIGWTPVFEIFSANSNAPHRFEVSHNAIDLILFSLIESFRSSIFIAPSQIEYCVCNFKWLNFCILDSGINGFYITINYFQ